MMKTSPTLQGLRYVHIEEDETEVARIQQALQAGGYEPQPLVVQTADELVAAIEQAEWDLILTDWTLPTFSAKAALAQLADRGVDLPMIVVSGVAGVEVAVDALKAGAHDYVLKDRLARLVPAVERVLREDAERKTAFRMMEEALRESQDGFRKLIEGAPLGIVFLDEQSRYVKVNQAFCHMVGYREDELIGQTYKRLTHPDDLAQSMALVGDMLNHQQSGYQLQKRYVRKDGQRIWVIVHPVNLALLGGRHYPLAAFVEDITERKQSEARSRLLKFSLDRTGMAIFWVDPSARILDVNDAACAMLGYSKDELCAMTLHDITVQAKPDLWPAYVRRLKQRETVRLETINRTKDGRIILVELYVNYLYFDGQEYICAFTRDITVPEQAHTAIQQSPEQAVRVQEKEAVERLAGGIAHDFNNLLTVINGQSQFLLSDQAVPDHIKLKLEQIQDAGLQAAGLTRQLLTFTRQQVLQPQAVDINRILTTMQRFLTRLMGDSIDIRMELEKSLGEVMMDLSQMEQIIMNLAANARDAMPHGGTLTLETRSVKLDADLFEKQGVVRRPGWYCLLSVQDTGIGMDKQTSRRVFEPFFTTKSPGMGIGVGLSTVHDIVLQSQGLITLSTELGQGAQFQVYLPRTTSSMSQNVAAGSTRVIERKEGETILVVEDEPLVSQFFCTVLSSQGYTVLQAATGKEAREISSSHQGEIHLVLSDIILLDERGPEIVVSLKLMRPGIKVLFMSGYLGVESEQERLELQDSLFLQKPILLPVLLETVRKVLDSA